MSGLVPPVQSMVGISSACSLASHSVVALVSHSTTVHGISSLSQASLQA